MSKKKITVVRIILIVFTVLIAATIFYLSADSADASNAKSEILSDSLAFRILRSFNLSDAQIENIFGVCSFLVRKLAHFSEYAALGFFVASVCTAFYKTRVFTYIVSQVVSSLYAVSDEVHQYFVPGRSCQLRDMLIDSAGALTGILVLFVILLIYNCIKKHKTKRALQKGKKII